MKNLKILLMTIMLLGIAANGWCGWWIFGQSQDEVTINYLYLNGTSIDELAEKATIYKNTLDNGEVLIKGKATAGKNRIAKIEISLDNKAVWQDVTQENGVFNYRFTPDAGKTYDFYLRATDTRGRTNGVDSTYRKLTVSGQNIRGMVIELLNNLVAAYQTKNSTQFMSHVSPNFAGDQVYLDRAIRRDFSLFDNIRLSYTINSITASAGRISASITYNRSLTGTRTNVTYRDNGMTEFTFAMLNDGLSVYSMKNPLIFGLSAASEVATGTSANSPNTPVIVVDNSGSITTVPFKDSLSETSGGSPSGSSPSPSSSTGAGTSGSTSPSTSVGSGASVTIDYSFGK